MVKTFRHDTVGAPSGKRRIGEANEENHPPHLLKRSVMHHALLFQLSLGLGTDLVQVLSSFFSYLSDAGVVRKYG